MTIKSLWQSVSRSEKKFLQAVVIILIIVTAAPYLYGYVAAGDRRVYTGLHALAPGDIPVYYSYINQVKSGSDTVKDLFTAERQNTGIFNVWWWWVGKLAGLFNLSAPLAFHLSRIMVLPFFVVVVYLFVSLFFKDAIKRRVALLFVLFSAGLGVYFSPFFSDLPTTTDRYLWPIDLWLTEAVTFNALYHSSHFAASLMFSVAILGVMILALEKNNWHYGITGGLLALFYFNFHPFYAPVIYAVLFVYLCYLQAQARQVDWRKIFVFMVFLALSLPMVFYHWWVIVSEPVLALRAMQNITTISPLLFVFVGYGLLWLGGILGVVYLIRKYGWQWGRFIVLVSWLIVNLILIYSPIPFGSRYIQGTHIILSILTVSFLFWLTGYLKQKHRRFFQAFISNKVLLVVLFVLFFSMSIIFSIARDIYYFTYKPGITNISMFIPIEIKEALDWLHFQKKGAVLADPNILAKFVPAFAQQPVFVAHGIETISYQEKLDQFKWFWSGKGSDKAKYNFLERANIKYVFFSPYEKSWGDYNPDNNPYLQAIFKNNIIAIYQVK